MNFFEEEGRRQRDEIEAEIMEQGTRAALKEQFRLGAKESRKQAEEDRKKR